MNKKLQLAVLAALSAGSIGFASTASAANANRSGVACATLPTYADLKAALAAATNTAQGGTQTNDNGGFHLPMWATLVDSTGRVCAVAKLDNTDPWLGSRVISAQKANTANAFSIQGLALSTANLYSAVQPGGSLYGLQHSNPVNTLVAYRGDGAAFGGSSDPMVGLRVGGVNVFGGGLALYNATGQAIGAIGVSGDTSCADHNIAWNLRAALAGKGGVVNKVPGGVGTPGDNIIFDITANPAGGTGVSTSGFGHAGCVNTVAPNTASNPGVGF